MSGEFGTFSLADIAQQAQTGRLREQQMQMQQQEFEARQQERAAQSEQQELASLRERAGMIARLTRNVTDEATYQQARQAAHAYGIDVSEAPPNFDPAWVQTQHVLADTFFREGPERMTTTAQELVESGLQFGTPEFQQAMAQRLAMKDSKVVNTTAGGMSGMLGPGGYQPFILPNPGGAQPGAPASGGVQEGATATNPQTGQKIVFRGGQWVPMGGGGGNAPGNFPSAQ